MSHLFNYVQHKLQETIGNHKSKTNLSADDIVQIKGWHEALMVLAEYMDRDAMPMLQGKQRDEWLIDKMSRLRFRYFEPL